MQTASGIRQTVLGERIFAGRPVGIRSIVRRLVARRLPNFLDVQVPFIWLLGRTAGRAYANDPSRVR